VRERGIVVSSRCHTDIPILGRNTGGRTNTSASRYNHIWGAVSPDHSSQLNFSDQWFGPHAFIVGSTPGSATYPVSVCERC